MKQNELYIVAVSGGVDSVALLHYLVSQDTNMIVAHVNHGIRPDSDEDERFVATLADTYGLPFEATRLRLGWEASEERARNARYDWLESARRQHGAVSIVTAHHEDDVIETMLLNLVRGTGWRGIASLRDTAGRRRPLLGWSKARIVGYAIEHGLDWREDSTNESMRYLRNRIRHLLMPKLSARQRSELVRLNASQLALRTDIDTETKELTDAYCEGGQLRRYPLIMLDEPEALEILRQWLGEPLEHARQRELLLFLKTARNGAKWSLDRDRFILASTRSLIELTASG